MKAGWEHRPIGEICLVNPPKSEVRKRLQHDVDVAFVPMNDLPEGEKSFNARECRGLSSVINAYTYFAEGDVLLAKITPCFENGKLSVARNLTNGIGFGSSEFLVIRSRGTIEPDYLFYFLSQEEFRASAQRVMAGAVGHKRVPKEYIESLSIPVPPLEEQRRIVATLDGIHKDLSRIRINIEANLTDAKALLESTIHFEFASSGDWPYCTLDRIAENLDSVRVPVTKRDRKKGPIPYYGASGAVDWVAGHLFDEELLLISEDGANLLARTYPIAFSIKGKSWVNNHAHVLRFPDRVTQSFVEIFLNSISLEPFISGMAQPKLNQKAMNSIPIPLPDMATRKRIVEVFHKTQAETKYIQDNNRASVADLAALRQSLLTKSFRGELT